MDSISEGRVSDSPYVEMIWRGQAGSDYAPVCPADSRWNLLLLRQEGKVRVSVEGPLSKTRLTPQPEGIEWLVIKFKLGAFLPSLPVKHLVDTAATLPLAAKNSFWLSSTAWQLPDYENADTFIDMLVYENVLLYDPVVAAALQEQPQELSLRTVRRHFLYATGLTRKTIQQIERAQRASALLEQGIPLVDVVYQTGYADQPHMTRALKHFIGQTPAQIARTNQPE